MELRDRDDRAVAAGEYVLGLLGAEERRQFEEIAQADAALRAEVQGWERRLAPLALHLVPVAPRPIVWLNLLHTLGGDARRATRKPPQFLRQWAALATAASLVLGFGLYREMTAPKPAPVVVTERVPVTAESYVAALSAPGKGAWAVSFVPGTHQLRAIAVGEQKITAQNDAELWLITDAGPVSLGLMPKSGELRRALPLGLPSVQGRVLAVSLEPAGGSKIKGPSGPVLTTAPLLRAS